MPKLVGHIADVEATKLQGRDLQWVVTKDTVGAQQMSVAIMHCHPHAIVRPMHAHKNIEEVLLVLDGKGVAWVDGELYPFEKDDVVRFPADSKHQVRNTGDETLVTASIFAGVTNDDNYVNYDEDAFGGDEQ